MKNLIIHLTLCFIFLYACQIKPQDNSTEKKHLLESCDTTYSSIVPKENPTIENLDQNTYEVQFSKSVLSNIETLKDSLYNTENLEIHADSILDVNGDGYLDLIVESYAGAGFGTKNLHSLYLFNPKTKLYANTFERFLNVAFFPKMKIFTSTYFGEDLISGEKYKWEGLRFTKIETASMEKYTFCKVKNIVEGKILLIKNCSECFPQEYLSHLNLH